MKFKKLFKSIPIVTMSASLVLAATLIPPIFTNENTSTISTDLNTTTNNTQTVASTSDIEYISSPAHNSSFAIVKDAINGDRLYGWGRNWYGELGIGNENDQSLPQLCDFENLPSKATFNSVHTGNGFTIVIVNGNSLYISGKSDWGEHGSGGDINNARIDFFRKSTALADGKTISLDDAGKPLISLSRHVLAVIGGELYAWGYNGYGEIGNGVTSMGEYSPVKVPGLPPGKIKGVYAVGFNSFVWIDNTIWAWGIGNMCSVDENFRDHNVTSPILLTTPRGTISHFAATFSTFDQGLNSDKGASSIVIVDNKIYGRGYNARSELGTSGSVVKDYFVDIPMPSTVASKTASEILALESAFGIVFEVKDAENVVTDRQLYMSGRNDLGQSGNGFYDDSYSFDQVSYVSNATTKYQSSALGIFATSDGVTHAWGGNEYGNFGIGVTEKVNVDPVEIDAFGFFEIGNSKENTNKEIIASDALKDFYTNKKIDKTKLQKYINITLPANAELSVTTGTDEPKVDNITKTISFNVTISSKNDFASDGQKTSDVKRFDKGVITITGFKSPIKTQITAKTPHPKDVVVDKWFAAVTGRDVIPSNGAVVTDKDKLREYLDEQDVPADATITILQDADITKVYNYKTGELNFKIKTNKVIDYDDQTLTLESDEFAIKLNLIPRITVFEEIDQNPDNIYADQLQLFNENKLDITEFAKYYNIIAPAPDAEYFLVPDSYQVHTGNGTIKFKIYANKYYDADAKLTMGNTTTAYFPEFTLQLNKTPSIIEEIADVIPEHRVDQFITSITNASGVVTDLETLNKYIKTDHLPSDSVLSISNEKDPDFNEDDYWDTITFDLKASKFNKLNNSVVNDEIVACTLKLLPQYRTTNVVVKTAFVNADRIDVFKNKIDTLSGSDLITYLKNYLTFTSLRTDAEVSATITNYDAYEGILELNVDIKNYYDDNSDVNTGTKSISALSITLASVPTVVEVIKSEDKTIRLDRFVEKFANVTTGVVTNKAFLQTFVKFDFWNPNTSLKIDLDSIESNNATGDWSADLILGEANNSESERVVNVPFKIVFKFAEKYDTTTIEQLTEYPLIQLDIFKTTIFDENDVAKSAINDYLRIHSLPPDAQIKLISEPVIDYANAQLTMTVQATSFYDENSDLQTSSADITLPNLTKTFTFKLLAPETKIYEQTTYDQTPRVDRFANSIKNLTNDDLKTALANYVNFDFLPANVELNIDTNSINIINIPGTLEFNLIASRYFDAVGYLKTTSKAFPIKLSLANKYATTLITAKSILPDNKIRVDRFITALGASVDSPEITNLDVLYQYLEVVSIPENTKLSVDYNQAIQIDKETGVLEFSISINKYYDNDSDLQTANLSFPITLNLAALNKPTTITAKTTGVPETRVDRFLKSFMDPNTNRVNNLDTLKQYVDILSLPTSAELYVTNTNVNAKTGGISFNLIATQYYDADSDLQTDSMLTSNKPFPISLQLAPKVDPTDFIVKTTLPNDVLVHELTDYLTYKGELDKTRFARYVDIVSLPDNTKIDLIELSHSMTTGEIIYDIKVDRYHDGVGDLQIKPKTYNIILNLDSVNAETQIYALSKYPNDLNVVEFKQAVEGVDGSINLQNLTKFVGIESVPPTSVLSINWGVETTTTISFVIHASQFYNADHHLALNKDYRISLTFRNQAVETKIKAQDTYPQIHVLHFIDAIYPNDIIDYAQLAKYVDFSTMPHDAVLSITNYHTSTETGIVSFDVVTSAWYDENLQYQNTDKSFAIVLNLTPKHNPTNLVAIGSIEKSITVNQFWLLISTDGLLDHTKLSQYVDLETLVPNTTMQYLNPVKNYNNSISFDLVVDRYYDAEGFENMGRKVFHITINSLEQIQYVKTMNDLTWLYVVIALVGSTGLGLLWFLIFKNKKRKEENNKTE